MSQAPTLDLTQVRSSFPTLTSNPSYIFADNAGGSQCASTVISAITDYLTHSNVQLGAGYSVSQKATARVDEGVEAAARMFAPTGDGRKGVTKEEVVVMSSSTMAMENLTRAIEGSVSGGDEFVVMGEHEANAGPWKKLAARRGCQVKYWLPEPTTSPPSSNPYSITHSLPTLLSLITAKTRIVAITACSNLLGSLYPIDEYVRAVRDKFAERVKEAGVAMEGRKLEISIDCVAYAPHRRMDVIKWDVDFCVFSFYKVYGPHVGALYVRSSSLNSTIKPLVHHFLHPKSQPYSNSNASDASSASGCAQTSMALQPGGAGYECTYALTGVTAYLSSLTSSKSITAAYDAIRAHEEVLMRAMIGGLREEKMWERGVRIVGDDRWPSPASGDGWTELGEHRVPTVSFVVIGSHPVSSKSIVDHFDAKGNIGIRNGHFYAYTLVDSLPKWKASAEGEERKIDLGDAVVRISLVHYNTTEEVERILEVLREALEVK